VKRACMAPALVTVLVLASVPVLAEPFGEDWDQSWTVVQETHESEVRRLPDGSLDLDCTPSKHIYWYGGEPMHDFAVTARVKFLRADDKYSGFSLFIRWNGEVWNERDGFWLYLRPKFRSLYMSKVMDGKLDSAFDDSIEALRPKATPVNEWMTLRCEVVGQQIRVYLNDELHLTATDEGLFAILSGRIGFGAGDAHVIVADIAQTNLEQAGRIEGLTYSYLNKPTRGDADANILTDGQVNPREDQAFWRMLGQRPEIVFDLGGEYFVTNAILRAISSPALNIASAEVLGSDDGQTWRILSMLRNTDSRRADGEHEVAGDVRGVARYIKLMLNRPAADQDVELAEVEFYGRPPTDEDRQASAATVYDTGPAMPPTTDAEAGDANYFYLTSDTMRVAIDRQHGLVGGLWNREHDTPCLERQSDNYYLATRDGDTEADEYADQVAEVLADGAGGTVRLRCTNPKLPDITIEKSWSLSADGRRLIKRVAFTNTSEAPDRFLTHITGAIAVEDFRRGGVYMGCDRGLGARLFADEVTVPRQIGALGARNSKVVILHRYDLGWGVGQFRHKINDTWCRPMTARYYEKENHPPIYMPNGWEVGVCTLHLSPGEEQSTELHTALYNGRQTDFYGMWRNLPDVKAAWDAVSRPTWQLDAKTSANMSPPQMTALQDNNMLPITRSLAVADSGDLWYLTNIHGVWGEWFSDGVVESGSGAKIDTQWLKGFVDRMHAASPRIRTGVYTWAWAVHPRSKVFREHPDWFISRDRDGQVFNAYSNMVLNHLRLMSVPESMDELMDQFGHVIADFDGDYFYLDGGGGGANLIDWEHLTIDQDYHWEELYRRILQVTRACGDDKAVFFNARTGPHFDIGYYEGIDRMLHAATWRDSADGLSICKIRQAYDPDQIIIPLYWRTPTLPFYSNYMIGLGITPSGPLGAADLLLKLPYIEAAYETRRMTWLEADLQPDWRVDSETKIEAYALAHGPAAVVSVIDHREAPDGPAVVSADTRKLGLDPAKPVYAFIFGNRDIREGWEALPEAVRKQLYRDSGWALDTVGRMLDVRVIDQPGERIELAIPTETSLLRMAVLTNSPAAVFSVDGLRINYWAPEVLGASVAAELAGDTMTLSATAPEGGAEAIVCAPAGKRLTGDGVRPFIVGDAHLAIVPVPAGESTVVLALTDAPAAGDELTVTCPELVNSGDALTVSLQPAPAKAIVSITRNDVPVYAGELPVTEGTLTLPVPVQAREGDWKLRVSTLAPDGRLLTGTASFQTKGTFAPDIPPYRPPQLAPTRQIAEVDVTARGLHVIGTAIDTHDGRDSTQIAVVNAEALTFEGGSRDAPKTRWGYGFAGLEFERARVLTLKVANTFYNAWTFSRGVESFKPQYTSTFAGLMVDYHTPDGYTKRVALGMGLLNPKRTGGRPNWGKAAKPDEFVMLSDAIHESPETSFTIDLAHWAPPDWDGRCWVGTGAENVYPSRRLTVEVLENSDSREGKEILEGEALGELYKIKTYRIVRALEAPKVDGTLDDAAWAALEAADGFFMLGRAAEAPQPTRAWLTYDDANLYIAFDCTENARDLNISSEKLWGRDAVDIALNPSGDRTRFLQVIADATGDWDQFTHTADGSRFTWDGIQVAAGKHEGGYAVEMAIPLTSMQLRPRSGLKWAGNFARYRANDEMTTWAYMPGPAINDPERFAEFIFD